MGPSPAEWRLGLAARRPGLAARRTNSRSACTSGEDESSSEEDESEQSGSLARTTVRPARNRPVKKKESFNERLRAALERGNTPDESDCDAGPQVCAALPALRGEEQELKTKNCC